MSFNPLLYPTLSYLGAPFGQPIQLCKALDEQPAAVPLNFVWSQYGVSQANPVASVAVDLTTFATRPPLKAIRAVYIDNTASECSVFVYFPDTRCTITCAPFATAFSPVLTNGLNCQIIGRGFSTDTLAQTAVFLLNTPVNPGVSQEIAAVYPQYRASPQISRGSNIYTPGFAIPAIGDQWQSGQTPKINGIASVDLFGTPYTNGGIITLTDIWIAITSQSGANSGFSQVYVNSEGGSGTFLTYRAPTIVSISTTTAAAQPSLTVINQTGLQVKFDASERWRLQWESNAADNAVFLNYKFGFSYQGEQAQTFATIGTANGAQQPRRQLSAGSGVYGGVRFTAPQSSTLFYASLFEVTGNGSYQLELWANDPATDQPLAKLAESAPRAVTSGGDAELVFSFTTPPAMTAGVAYWIIIVPLDPVADSLTARNVGAVVGYTSGRNNVITAMTGNSVNGTDEWKMSITYQTL